MVVDVGVVIVHFRFLGRLESRFSIRRASASSQRCHVGIQVSTTARHRGFERSSASAAPLSRCSSRNFMRCFVTSSTLRRTECHEYGCFWPRVNSIVTVIHHLQRLLRWPKSAAWRLQISNKNTSSSFVVSRFPCFRVARFAPPRCAVFLFPTPFPTPFSAKISISISPSLSRPLPACPGSPSNSGSHNASAPLTSLVPGGHPGLSDRPLSLLSTDTTSCCCGAGGLVSTTIKTGACTWCCCCCCCCAG